VVLLLLLLLRRARCTPLVLHLGVHLLLMLGRTHHAPWPSSSTSTSPWHLLELGVEVVLRRHPTRRLRLWLRLRLRLRLHLLLLLLLLWMLWRGLRGGLGRRGLGATGRGRAGGSDAVAARRRKTADRPPHGLAHPLHAGHATAQHLRLLQAVLQLLLTQLVLDVEAEGHGALVLLAVLGVVAAQRD